MRRILVDHARKHRASKRGGGEAPLSLAEELVANEENVDIVALDGALKGHVFHDLSRVGFQVCQWNDIFSEFSPHNRSYFETTVSRLLERRMLRMVVRLGLIRVRQE